MRKKTQTKPHKYTISLPDEAVAYVREVTNVDAIAPAVLALIRMLMKSRGQSARGK